MSKLDTLEDLIDDVYGGSSPGERVVTSEQYLDRQRQDALGPSWRGSMTVTNAVTAREAADRLNTRSVTSVADQADRDVNDERQLPAFVPSLVNVVPVTTGSVKVVDEDASDAAGTLGLDPASDPSTDAVYREVDLTHTSADQTLVRWAIAAKVSEDVLEDEDTLRRRIDRVMTDVSDRALERDLLVGTNTSSSGRTDLQGILDASGTNAVDRDTANNEPRIDALRRGVTAIRNDEHRGPLSLVATPDVMEAIRLEKDADGNLLAEALSDVVPEITRYVASTFMPAGEALLGDFNAGSTLYLDSFAVQVAGSHKDWHLKGWKAIRVRSHVWHDLARPTAYTHLTSF